MDPMAHGYLIVYLSKKKKKTFLTPTKKLDPAL